MLKSEQAKTARADNRKKIDAYLEQKAAVTDWDPAADTDYQALLTADKRTAAQIAAFEESEKAERIAPAAASTAGNGTVITGGKHRSENDTERRGFRSTREFFSAVMENADADSKDDIGDERLRPLAVLDKGDKAAGGQMAYLMPIAFGGRDLRATVGSDEQGNYDDRYGGYALRETRLPGLLEVGFEGDPTAGRTMAVPMQSPAVSIEARTDKNHTSSVSGGLTVSRKAETAAAAASRAQMELVRLRAASLFGFNYTTEEMLADSPATVVALVQQGFATQFGAHMLNEKLRGLGGDQFDGIITAAATVTISKESGQVADTVVTANVVKMRARCWGYGQAIWLCNQDLIPSLSTMSVGVGAAGVLTWADNVRSDIPDTLLGRPVFFTEFASAKGDLGDIILANFSQYLEGVYQPLQSAESIHVRFANHERAFKFWLRNAGAPWWRSALTPAKSADSLSPFVILEAR